MRQRQLRSLLVTVSGTALVAGGLAGCAPGAADPTTNPGGATQSFTEACGVSSERVSGLVTKLYSSIDTASAEALSGSIPDLAPLFSDLTGSMQEITDAVTNPEVGAALTGVGAGLAGFADITPPDNVLGAPGYASSLFEQLRTLQDAVQTFNGLCKPA